MSARNSFPEDHPLFAGFLIADRAKIVAALDGHDVVLILGGPASLYHVEGSGPHMPPGAAVWMLTDNPTQAAWLPGGVAVLTSPKPGLATLLDGAGPAAPRATPAPRIMRPVDPARFDDRYVLSRLAALRDPASIIVEEAPSSREPMHDHLPITRRDGFYTCASGGLGHGLPAAIGVALGRPGEKVIALLGDGSSLYAIQGLWTAAQLGLPMTFVIINNGGYAALGHFARHFAIDRTYGTEIGGMDFVRIAEAQGLEARRATNAGELEGLLPEALASPRTNLIEVMVAS
jgi:benzoylformate decarboxylase